VEVVVVAEQLRRAVPGGIGTYVEGLAQGLRAMGAGRGAADHMGTEVARTAGQRPAGPAAATSGALPGARELPHVRLHASRLPRRHDADPVAALGLDVVGSPLPGAVLTRAWRWGLAAPPGADVLHATSLAVPWPRRSGPRRATAEVPRTSVMVHDLAWRLSPDAFPPRGRRWHESALQRALARADLLLSPSTLTADALLAAGADASRVEVVEEGCDHLPPADHAGATAVLARHGVAGPYLLSVGTLEPRKNLARLMAAYAEARPLLPDPWPLVVVGPPGWGPRLAPVPGVVLAGPVDAAALAALYAGARCFAYVPVAEGFGLPPVEAMACCTPVVASPVPSTKGAAL
jgi:glycosyltransferase involved in cell wall biosynthesis